MNQHDHIREALRDTQDFLTECEITLHLDIAQLRILEEKIKQALAAKQPPLVRLTDEDIERIFDSLPQFRLWAFTGPQKDFANAIMDAMQERNK